ncbi:DNA polymerase III subunit gamma/tau [Candidatus Fonsibacter ubiquis]|uniref:DNA polymerase III subunit gamma/tau n=1 Tax=Candidatus Fonsibacter ubiquis TaxID=1925548 RepID=UPI000C070C53|nr:DNA polymerase III subunit gamma/tau [Candidatus Fonsibacter ubiquis]
MENNRKGLSLKYRPQSFDEVIGQDVMVQIIKNAIKMDRIPNAYLLTGIRGVGKTTTARIIAKAINCKNLENLENLEKKCDGFCHCEAITNSNHIDVLEMDAASKTGIDDIRELIDSAKYYPTSAKYKVFIIDEVHMLSKQAFNGLLKTLEEPPPHLKFILATTEVKKIPLTIISRCQRFDLRRIKLEEMLSFLKRISEKEKAKINDKALMLIAKASEGSVRDALSILDQAISTFNVLGEEITEVSVRTMLGIADRSRIIDLVRLIIDGKKEQALEESQEIFDLGADPKLVLQDMLEVIYLISRSKSFGKIENDLTVSESESDLIFSLSKDIDFSYISMIWQFILKGIEELSFVPNYFLSFQMLIMRLIHLKDLPSPEQLIDDVLSSDTVGISESNEQKDDFNEIKPGTIINKQTSAKTQIKSVTQEKTEEIDRTPKILEKKKELENFEIINSFEKLVEITNHKKEIELKFDLERNVRVVKFEKGKIDISFNEKLSKNFVRSLTEKLKLWTGERWIISLSKETGKSTIFENKEIYKKKLLHEALESEVYKKIKENFPDAELSDVEEVK